MGGSKNSPWCSWSKSRDAAMHAYDYTTTHRSEPQPSDQLRSSTSSCCWSTILAARQCRARNLVPACMAEGPLVYADPSSVSTVHLPGHRARRTSGVWKFSTRQQRARSVAHRVPLSMWTNPTFCSPFLYPNLTFNDLDSEDQLCPTTSRHELTVVGTVGARDQLLVLSLVREPSFQIVLDGRGVVQTTRYNIDDSVWELKRLVELFRVFNHHVEHLRRLLGLTHDELMIS